MHPQRLERERRTLQEMISLYCRKQHLPERGLCADCTTLLAYALQRVERCPYKLNKPTCARCPVHCYKPEMRTRVRKVMRYAGPRMLLHHPWLALLHLLDGLTPARVE